MNSREGLNVKRMKIGDTFKFYDRKVTTRERTKKDFYDQLTAHWIKLYLGWSKNIIKKI